MTPDERARVAEIQARADAALPFDLATHAFQDVPWLLDRLRDETARADHNAAAVNANADLIVELRAEVRRLAANNNALRSDVEQAMYGGGLASGL